MTKFIACGTLHLVLLKNDGSVLALGDNTYGQCNIPQLLDDEYYIDIQAERNNTGLLTNTGRVIILGENEYKLCDVPELPNNLKYIKFKLYNSRLLLLRSDGCLLKKGYFYSFSNNPINHDLKYIDIVNGYLSEHILLKMDDNNIVLCGLSTSNQCNIPILPSDMSYKDIKLGSAHTVYLRNDGNVIAKGYNDWGSCNIPILPDGLKYVFIHVFMYDTVLLRSDNKIIICSTFYNERQYREMPFILNDGQYIVNINGNYNHLLLLLNDGSILSYQNKHFRKCTIPILPINMKYIEIYVDMHNIFLLRSDYKIIPIQTNFNNMIPDLPNIGYGFIVNNYILLMEDNNDIIFRTLSGSIVKKYDTLTQAIDNLLLDVIINNVNIAIIHNAENITHLFKKWN